VNGYSIVEITIAFLVACFGLTIVILAFSWLKIVNTVIDGGQGGGGTPGLSPGRGPSPLKLRRIPGWSREREIDDLLRRQGWEVDETRED
jgi:hypothetical protein